ncbi:MAG TPA: sulfatase [Planctomycetota bacterium]|jgi:arylsulfatase A-like enzyme|nr:sulfatase [Planctomycetota bacterium]
MRRGFRTLALVLAAAALACDPPAKRPNLLFISIDTLRADHLGAYGWNRPTSPNLDAFAAKSVVFENAQSASSWTLPSLASVMTSLQASTHGCEKDSARLDPSYTTLAEILRDAGYDTAIVASHLFLNAGHGLQQGFTRVDTRILQDERAITSPAVTDWGVHWLEQKAAVHDGAPWFLWLHYFDPHAPYLVHEGISEAFGTETDLDRYDGEIAFTDRHLGRLFEAFERLGFAADTVVVLVADHGEEFGEHGQKGHGYDLHEEVIHVPLVVRAPGLAPRRVPEPVPTVDLMPTLLDLCGARADHEIEGRTLAPLLRGEGGPAREAFSEARWKFRHDIASLRRGPWKYIDSHRGDEVLEMLFDHAVDPAETKNVLAEHPDVAAELRAGLRARLERAKALAKSYERLQLSDLTPSEEERLRRLGYAGGDK